MTHLRMPEGSEPPASCQQAMTFPVAVTVIRSRAISTGHSIIAALLTEAISTATSAVLALTGCCTHPAKTQPAAQIKAPNISCIKGLADG